MSLPRSQLIVLFLITVGVANRSISLSFLLEEAERDTLITLKEVE